MAFIILFIAILGISILSYYLKTALFRGIDEIDNRKRQKYDKENGPAVEKLSNLYGQDDDLTDENK